MSMLHRLKVRAVCRNVYNPFSSISEYAVVKAAGELFECKAKERELFKCRKAREGMVANDWDVRIADYGYTATAVHDTSDDDSGAPTERFQPCTPPNADVDKPVATRIM